MHGLVPGQRKRIQVRKGSREFGHLGRVRGGVAKTAGFVDGAGDPDLAEHGVRGSGIERSRV